MKNEFGMTKAELGEIIIPGSEIGYKGLRSMTAIAAHEGKTSFPNGTDIDLRDKSVKEAFEMIQDAENILFTPSLGGSNPPAPWHPLEHARTKKDNRIWFYINPQKKFDPPREISEMISTWKKPQAHERELGNYFDLFKKYIQTKTKNEVIQLLGFHDGDGRDDFLYLCKKRKENGFLVIKFKGYKPYSIYWTEDARLRPPLHPEPAEDHIHPTTNDKKSKQGKYRNTKEPYSCFLYFFCLASRDSCQFAESAE